METERTWMETERTWMDDKYDKLFARWIKGDEEDFSGLMNNRKYANAEQMAEAMKNYFIEKEKFSKPISYLGLAVAIGFTTRKSLDRYMNHGNKFKSLIKFSKTLIELYLLEGLYDNFKQSQWILRTNYRERYGDEITQIIKNNSYTVEAEPPDENIKKNSDSKNKN